MLVLAANAGNGELFPPVFPKCGNKERQRGGAKKRDAVDENSSTCCTCKV